MNKFIMFFKFFFCDFRTFNFSRSINRINNHFFFVFSIRKVLVRVSYSFFHGVNLCFKYTNYIIIRYTKDIQKISKRYFESTFQSKLWIHNNDR